MPLGRSTIPQDLMRLLDVFHELHQSLDRQARKIAGMPFAQLSLLERLSDRRTSATITDLAGLSGRANHSVTTLVDALERKKLVTRSKAKVDRRQVMVSLTPAGADLLAKTRGEIWAPLVASLAHFERPGNRDLLVLTAEAIERLIASN